MVHKWWLFTIFLSFVFHSAGETPDIFKLCRRDESTEVRHFRRRHQGKKPVIMPFNDKNEKISKAREYATKWDNNKKANVKVEKSTTQQVKIPAATLSSKDVVPSIFSAIKSTSLESARETDQPSFSNDDRETSQDKPLHHKIDMLTSEVRNLKLHLKSGKEVTTTGSTSLAAVDGKCVQKISQVLIKWPEIKNIIDLVNICDHIRFFAGDEIDGVLSLVRCETCYKFLLSKRASGYGISKPDTIAKKGLGG